MKRKAEAAVTTLKHIRPYVPYVAGLGVLNAVIIVLFEFLRPAALSWDGLWNARTAIWAGLLLFDNLLVLWWYAHLTGEVAKSTTTQAAVSQRQQDQSERPCVLIEWQFAPPSLATQPAGHTYVARNVGRGIALNVLHVEDLDSPNLELLHIGALEPGQSTQLPTALVERLNVEERDHLERKRHLLIAEPVGGTEWIVTENRMEPGGRLSHRVRVRKLSPEQVDQIHQETPDEYIRRHWTGIQAELAKELMRRELAKDQGDKD